MGRRLDATDYYSPKDFNEVVSGFRARHPVVEHRLRRVSTVVVQRFCKPKVGGSNPSPGTSTQISG